MSRFADPTATARFVLPGGCQCQGKPHDDDWMELRTQLSGIELAEFASAPADTRLRMLIVSWNLIGDDGTVAPIDDEYLRRLYSDIFEPLDSWVTEHLQFQSLPNGSGAPSANGSRASASRHTRTTRPR